MLLPAVAPEGLGGNGIGLCGNGIVALPDPGVVDKEAEGVDVPPAPDVAEGACLALVPEEEGEEAEEDGEEDAGGGTRGGDLSKIEGSATLVSGLEEGLSTRLSFAIGDIGLRGGDSIRAPSSDEPASDPVED